MDRKICAVCCGTEREVSLNCPLHCPYLVAAHRYEEETLKTKPLANSKEMPFADVEFPPGLIQEHELLAVGACATILKFAGQHPMIADADVLSALSALVETARTRAAGIYYERKPDDPLCRDLYAELATFLADTRKREAEHAGYTAAKDSDIFHILVFLVRLATQRSNRRPRSKAFLGFLQRQFPPIQEPAQEESRLIIP
ncbi:MAG TPA: hypothetical protein VOA41_06125 [Candidatus Dormibacteraeota bacterium]|nr:hypothetical protein [Candidatus Dormibacteraeota bacterium]